ncbi:MAG: ATP-binding protein [Candidatus Fermentibacteria bacterium]
MYKNLLTMNRRTWYQVGRFIILGLFVLFGILFLGWSSVGIVYSAVGFVVVVSVFLDILFRKSLGDREWQVWLQFILDSILASILIRMAGGFDGPFTAFFFIHTFTAGVFLGIKGGVTIAVLDTLMIASMAFISVSSLADVTPTGSAFEKLVHAVPSSISFQYALLFVMIYAGFLTITGLVSGYLSQHLLLEKGRSEGILRELREAKTISREILESLSDGILVIDKSGNPVSINQSGRRILSLGKQWRDRVCDTDIYTMLNEFQLSGGMPPVIELSMGETVLECRMGIFLDHEGNSAGALVAMTDITETFELKRQLQEQEKLAAIGRLSSTMAHEIRNPLASMSGAAHILQMGTLDWKKTDRMTELISSQAKRISEIIEGYLELSRESTVSYTNSVSLAAVVNEATDVARQGFGGLIGIETNIEGDFIIFGNQARLVQLLTNVMRNSVEALVNSSDGKITVSLVKSAVDGMVELRVHDNGPGIPNKVMIQMFEPFFTTKKEGTGLGLFVARKVARDHRGRIDIESESGEGTTVRVSIPVVPPDAASAEIGGD